MIPFGRYKMTKSKIRNIHSHRSTLWLGALDVLSASAYVINANPTYFHAATLALKLLLLVKYASQVGSSAFARSSWIVVALFAITIMISMASNIPTPEVMGQYLIFLVHLSLSLLIIQPEHWKRYAQGVAIFLGGLSILFILQSFLGMIPTEWERYTYFSGGAANLGAEIGTVGVVAAAISLRTGPAIIAFIVGFYPIMLMQGRAALLVIIGSIAIRLVIDLWTRCKRSKLGRKWFVIGLSVFCLASSTFAIDTLSKLLLIDDASRGAGTDFVGRGERWTYAYNKFVDNPVLGAGLGWFENSAAGSPHNFYLYGLSQFGFLSLLIFVPMVVCCIRGWRANKNDFLVLSPMLILTVFNDRFMNLNAYPFVMFVVLLSASCLPAEAPRRVRRPSRRRVASEQYVSLVDGI